ncbi:MAG: hypothetical protein KF708_04520 [Pirellulales bacterium]|nr:hypothetical protein [Pirellulales bacterium]
MTPSSAAASPLFTAAARPAHDRVARDPAQRFWYARAALVRLPRLLGAIDRNPYHATYGCLDRQFWHYRTAAFPSEMYQEGALALALAFTTPLPDNRWFGAPRVRELAIAALRFSARYSHADGSCDDYYPYERALGAAVFSLQAATRAYEVLQLDDAELRRAFARRAQWIAAHDESGRLSNHHALAALALARTGRVLDCQEWHDAAEERLRRLLAWQTDEGWFEEYGGADPGYQTVTIDCLAKYQRLTPAPWLDEPLRRAVKFARLFLHPDGGYGGEYGSRGTYHFYPHGMELLSGGQADAADLADAFLGSLARDREASFDDDRLIAHRLANLVEAYEDWSSTRPARPEDTSQDTDRYLPGCRMLIARRAQRTTIVSAARGGSFKHFAGGATPVVDSGLVVEFSDGRVAVSQQHDLARDVAWRGEGVLDIRQALTWARHETATPTKQAIFHVGMAFAGRWCRELVRRLLQRRLITGKKRCPVHHTRRIELAAVESNDGPSLRVTDTLEIVDRRLTVRRLSIGSDHQSAYVAATNIYHDDVLCPWIDLSTYVDELNRTRRVTIQREFL